MRQIFLAVLAVVGMVAGLGAQQRTVPPTPASAPPAPSAVAATAPSSGTSPVTPPADYVIGPGDLLNIVFWREPDMSAKVAVRPDGRISIPLLNDITVTGLTPEELRKKLSAEAQRFVQDPNVTVVVEQINSRRVFIVGQVSKAGPYPLTTSMNVMQLIATAGGLLEYADEKAILVTRTENGKVTNFKFNYKDMVRGKNPAQNIDLKPGDTVLVP